MKYLVSIGIIASLCFDSVVMATDYYINPTGNDLWSGTIKQPNIKQTDGPFKTLERAKQSIRSLKKNHTFNDKVTINIAAGRYYPSQPLNFNLMDSGLPGREILWQGEPGKQVTISGGLPISCKKRDATFWDCPLTKLPVNKAFFDTVRINGNVPKFELFVNDQKMELARWPDQGWAHIKLPLERNTQISVMEALPNLAGYIKSAQVHIFAGNDWYDQYVGIDSFSQSLNAITLSAVPVYAPASGRRLYIRNLPSLLNAPGEWIADINVNKISFIAPAGMTPTSFELTSLPNNLVLDGASYLTFKNLNFQYSTATAITMKNSSNIILDHLDVNNIGGKGIEIHDGQNVQLINSKIHHVGGGGVLLTGGDRSTLQSSRNIVHNNYIHNYDVVLMASAPAIDINGVGASITNNLIEYGNGVAIWLQGNEHIIEKNELHHICMQNSDCGAIYSGRDWSARGNSIRYNFIHDIIGYGLQSVDIANNRVVYDTPGGARGVYLDDAASGFEVTGNIFENAGLMSLQIGGGRDNRIINNYFISNDYAIVVDDRWPAYDWSQNQKNLEASPYKNSLWQHHYPELLAMQNPKWPEGNLIERNIIVTTSPNGLLLRYILPSQSTVIAKNLLWSTTGKLSVDYQVLGASKFYGGATWPQWTAEKIEQGSIIGDPCVTISNKKMTICPGSPVKEIGFKTLPTDIGLLNSILSD